jgi:hypothetical protein
MIPGIDVVRLDLAGRARIQTMLIPARDQPVSILQGIADLEADPKTTVVHGAAVATNALAELSTRSMPTDGCFTWLPFPITASIVVIIGGYS